MAAVLPEQIGTIGHNPAVIDLLSIVVKCASSITATKDSIGVFRDRGQFTKGLGKVFSASLGFWIHTGCIGIMNATGTMDHKLLDQLKELLIGVWIREFCTKGTVDSFWSAKFICRIHRDNIVGMRKRSFLKLVEVDKTNALSKTAAPDVFDKFISLGMKNTIDNVCTFRWFLSWK